jgi:hypothetical protein
MELPNRMPWILVKIPLSGLGVVCQTTLDFERGKHVKSIAQLAASIQQLMSEYADDD